MPLGSVFWLREEVEELRHAGIRFFIFALHHPQAGPADNGVLRCIFRIGVVRHHAYAVVKFGVLTNVGKRTGRGGGHRAITVIELLSGFILTPDVAEIALLVHLFEHSDVFHLLRLVELQHRVCAVKAVVFAGKRQTVPGAKVFQLDPALPAAGVAALHTGGFQFRGIVRQILPGFRRLFRV